MQIKKNKWTIILILILVSFFTWIYVGPDFLSIHFHELDEAYIEKMGKIDRSNKSSITYVIDKFELRPNSYREIIEISGFAFKELKKEIKIRDIFLILESTNVNFNNYIIKTQLLQRQGVINVFLPGKEIENYTDVGYYAKFSAIGVKNGNYKISIMVKENNKIYYSNTQFMIKKDKGMITILSKEN